MEAADADGTGFLTFRGQALTFGRANIAGLDFRCGLGGGTASP